LRRAEGLVIVPANPRRVQMKPSQIEVSEIKDSLSPAMREGAMLYAEGRVDDAIRLLRDATSGQTTSERLPWLLLLDLYRIKDDLRGFEFLAQRYAAAFARPSPPWDIAVQDSTLAPELRNGGPACCELSNSLDETIATRFTFLRHSARNHSIIRFDLRELHSITPAGCALLSIELERLVAESLGIVFSGAERLEQLLRELLAVDLEETACWKLLLDLLQIQGRQRDYEVAAMNYGIALLVDPPEWQAVLLPKPPTPTIEEKRSSPRYQAASELFWLSGSMAGAENAQLAALRVFASDKQYLNIQFRELQRIDLVCARHFINALSAWQQEGKTIRLIGANTLVASALLALGVVRYAKFVMEKEEA
jgi:ABC-type transporter Mla MlaB component